MEYQSHTSYPAEEDFACDSDASYATVVFVSADDKFDGIIRVPIGPETDVRRLAKEGMRRLVMMRRSRSFRTVPKGILETGFDRGTERLAVTEIAVMPNGAMEPTAEIFSSDLVTQVVRLRQEVIVMYIMSVPRPVPAADADVAEVPALNRATEGAEPSTMEPSATVFPCGFYNTQAVTAVLMSSNSPASVSSALLEVMTVQSGTDIDTVKETNAAEGVSVASGVGASFMEPHDTATTTGAASLAGPAPVESPILTDSAQLGNSGQRMYNNDHRDVYMTLTGTIQKSTDALTHCLDENCDDTIAENSCARSGSASPVRITQQCTHFGSTAKRAPDTLKCISCIATEAARQLLFSEEDEDEVDDKEGSVQTPVHFVTEKGTTPELPPPCTLDVGEVLTEKKLLFPLEFGANQYADACTTTPLAYLMSEDCAGATSASKQEATLGSRDVGGEHHCAPFPIIRSSSDIFTSVHKSADLLHPQLVLTPGLKRPLGLRGFSLSPQPSVVRRTDAEYACCTPQPTPERPAGTTELYMV